MSSAAINFRLITIHTIYLPFTQKPGEITEKCYNKRTKSIAVGSGGRNGGKYED